MNDPKEIISKLKSILQEDNQVLGLVLVGSYAREDVYAASKYSDVEAYIVVEDKNVAAIGKRLPFIVSKLGKVVFSYKNRWAGFSTLFDDLFRVELPVAKPSELETVFSRPKAQTVKILIDRTNGKLERALLKRPKILDFEKLFQENYLDFWYLVTAGIQYFKKGELFNARNILQIIQSSLVKNLELLQDPKTLLLETNKRVEMFLSKEQLDMIRDIILTYDHEEIKNSFVKIITVFSETSKNISQKYNYSYESEIEDEVKQKLIQSLTP